MQMLCSRRSAAIILRRGFSASARVPSHVGSAPIYVPTEVSFALDLHNRNLDTDAVALHITGPKGVGKVQIPPFANIELVDSGRQLEVRVADSTVKQQRQMWGTLRSLIQNHVTGVTQGHSVILTFSGTGYRAELLPSGRQVSVKVGQTGATVFDLPENITAVCPQPTRLLLEGPDKHAVSQFGATIRSLKPPEPYKGKGIYMNNETIKLKSKSVK
ncbi:mitochondrial 54S ribosomal protein uL6m [Kockiozyma suomiensis]|uniref:mitochondrial 54S ribosomal protein uL6m n=1 Tax=Kockiozyma suomiensis TaxID=1337062 RepID=UPI0033442F72